MILSEQLTKSLKNMSMLKVSIVIPVYNVSEYIKRCLLSVLNQTYNNIEVIIVNDCTPDNSMDIVDELLRSTIHNKEVKIQSHKVNRGLSAARNTGIKNATGDYIYFLDSDDEITCNAIELLVKRLNSESMIDFIVGNFRAIEDPSGSLKRLSLDDRRIYIGEEILSSFANKKWYVMAWNKLVNLDFLREEELYFKEGVIHEDVLWSFLLANKAQSMGVVKEDLYKYYIRPQSIVSSPSIRNIDNKIIIATEIHNLMIEGSIPQNTNNIIFSETLKKDMVIDICLTRALNKNSDRLFFYKRIKSLKITNSYHRDKDLSDIVIQLSYKLPSQIGFYLLFMYAQLLRIKRILIPPR